MAQETIKKTKLKPLGNRVLVQRLEPQETMKGGIILPDSAKKKQETAKVVELGTGKRLDDGTIVPIPLKVGDVILMDKYSGQEVTVEDVEFVIFGAPNFASITTFRPFGPSVTFTADASVFTPFKIFWRASSLNLIFFGAIV